MSLTSFDFLMCLGSYINRIAGDFVPTVPADNVLTSSDKLLRSCASYRKLENCSCGQPADRAYAAVSHNCSIFTYSQIHNPHTNKTKPRTPKLTPLTPNFNRKKGPSEPDPNRSSLAGVDC